MEQLCRPSYNKHSRLTLLYAFRSKRSQNGLSSGNQGQSELGLPQIRWRGSAPEIRTRRRTSSFGVGEERTFRDLVSSRLGEFETWWAICPSYFPRCALYKAERHALFPGDLQVAVMPSLLIQQGWLWNQDNQLCRVWEVLMREIHPNQIFALKKFLTISADVRYYEQQWNVNQYFF